MIRNEKIPWKRLTVEAAAIVGSILLAFAIDAWWDERLERAEENEQLIRLRAEFNTNIERIDERLSFSRMVESSSEFFTLIEAGLNQGQPTIDVPTTTLIWFLIAPTFEADTPIFNGLIQSGRLAIIEDKGILAALSKWERFLRDYTELAQRARRNLDSHILPALYSRGDVGLIMMRPRSISQFTIKPDVTGFVSIRIDEELKGLVAGRFNNSDHAQQMFVGVRAAAENVVAAIDAGQANN